MTILVLLVCLIGAATVGGLYLRAKRRKARKRMSSRYFRINLTEDDIPIQPTDSKL